MAPWCDHAMAPCRRSLTGIKDIEENEKETVVLQRRGLRFKGNLPKRYELKESNLFPLMPIPSDGIAAYAINGFIGRKRKRDLKLDDYLKEGDVVLC